MTEKEAAAVVALDDAMDEAFDAKLEWERLHNEATRQFTRWVRLNDVVVEKRQALWLARHEAQPT